VLHREAEDLAVSIFEDLKEADDVRMLDAAERTRLGGDRIVTAPLPELLCGEDLQRDRANLYATVLFGGEKDGREPTLTQPRDESEWANPLADLETIHHCRRSTLQRCSLALTVNFCGPRLRLLTKAAEIHGPSICTRLSDNAISARKVRCTTTYSPSSVTTSAFEPETAMTLHAMPSPSVSPCAATM
jgi:hypothetical protein